jgi:hypothetical protein
MLHWLYNTKCVHYHVCTYKTVTLMNETQFLFNVLYGLHPVVCLIIM